MLGEARALGFLGPAPVSVHRSHAEAFVDALRPAPRILDLGSGGGLPGLVVAGGCPDSAVVLLDARLARIDFLRRVIGRLGWGHRVRAVAGRAEVLARQVEWRGSFDAVVARSFGPPAVTAECAAGFLAAGGQLLVSEPPGAIRVASRWPAEGLAQLGLALDPPLGSPGEWALRSCTQLEPCPADLPRRRAAPPLW